MNEPLHQEADNNSTADNDAVVRSSSPQQPDYPDPSLLEEREIRQKLNNNEDRVGTITRPASDTIISPSSSFGTSTYNHQKYDTRILEAPDFGQYKMMISILIFVTLLAVVSAWDAFRLCEDAERQDAEENDENKNENDDNRDHSSWLEDSQAECLFMFQYVIVPVGVSTLVLGLGTLLRIATYVHYLQKESEEQVIAPLHTLNESNNENGKQDARDGNKQPLQQQVPSSPSHFSILLQLLVPLTLIGAVWSYGNFAIMLRPKRDPNGYLENPYRSLAAVDQMGHIGFNANLYYLSWISQALALVLVYHVFMDCVRWGGARARSTTLMQRAPPGTPDLSCSSTFDTAHALSVQEQIHAILEMSSARNLAKLYKKKRKSWYEFMVRLRSRSAFWVGAFGSSLLIFASSGYLYIQVLMSLATRKAGEGNYRFREICTIVDLMGELPHEFCARTTFSVFAGAAATILCLPAMFLHIFVRRKAAHATKEADESCGVVDTQLFPEGVLPEISKWQLRLEFSMSLILFLLLGMNAVLVTGVQGPAAEVGNLYYASWVAFLLCLRICLGCLEELYHIPPPSTSSSNREKSGSVSQLPRVKPVLASKANNATEDRSASQDSFHSGSQLTLDMNTYRRMARLDRPERLRKYFILSIFSAICTASALDAAYHQEDKCTSAQLYVIAAPAVVSILSVTMFFLCLRPRTYLVVSNLGIGGILALVCFGIWVGDIVVTMHDDNSWAVTEIGEMKLANLYYFSWMSVLVSALLLLSYVKPFLGEKGKDIMLLVWASIMKVCMVILGASLHVWHSIGEDCQAGTVDARFCSRTKFATKTAIIGYTCGWLVVVSRFFGCSISQTVRNRIEATLSMLLVLLFGAAVALITGIGGPGQSVGDLYYATWLSFWVCISIFMSCYDQLRQQDVEWHSERYNDAHDSGYVDFEDIHK